jgi:TATA-binding protein-associated factor
LDRLLLLLDTGSSTSVRNTAAKQLAQLAAKSVISDVALEEDLKNPRQHVSLGDPQAWAELMSVVARVRMSLNNRSSHFTIAQIIPFLHSKSFDTRTAASVALSQIFSLVPLWQPELKPEISMDPSLPAPDFPVFSVQELISQGKLLLASSGKEFVKPAGILSSPAEVKKARKAAMSRLGLDFLDEDDLEIEKELADEMDLDIDGDMEPVPMPAPVKSEEATDADSSLSPMDLETKVKRENTSAPTTRSATPADPSPTSPNNPDTDLSALSARERNRLKRKRKPGNSAFVAAPPPQSAGAKYTPAPAAGNSHKYALTIFIHTC